MPAQDSVLRLPRNADEEVGSQHGRAHVFRDRNPAWAVVCGLFPGRNDGDNQKDRREPRVLSERCVLFGHGHRARIVLHGHLPANVEPFSRL